MFDVGVGHLIPVFVVVIGGGGGGGVVIVVVVDIVDVADIVIVVTAALNLIIRITRCYPFFPTVALTLALGRIGNSGCLRGLFLLFWWLAGAEINARGCICR